MFSRTIAVFIASWLPCIALMVPLSPFHTVNSIAAGLVATALAAFALVSDRARVGAAIVGAWVAFTPFVFRSSLTEIVISVCWGVTMFVSLIGPFSQEPDSTIVRALKQPVKEARDQKDLQVAA